MAARDDSEAELDVEFEEEEKSYERLPWAMFIHLDEPDDPGPEWKKPPVKSAHWVSDGAVICYGTLSWLGARKRQGKDDYKITRVKIARRMGKSVRMVQNYLNELVAAGWILRKPTYGSGGRRASKFRVLIYPLTGPEDPRAKWLEQR